MSCIEDLNIVINREVILIQKGFLFDVVLIYNVYYTYMYIVVSFVI